MTKSDEDPDKNKFITRIIATFLASSQFSLPLLCGFFFAALSFFRPPSGEIANSSTAPVIVGLTAIVSISIISMMKYLQGNEDLSSHHFRPESDAARAKREREFRNLKLQVETLLSTPTLLSAKELTSAEHSKILNGLKESVQLSLKAELAAEFELKYSSQVADEVHLKSIRRMFDSTRDRLLQEIISLGRRGNLNLALGSSISLTGLLALGYVVFTHSDSNSAFVVNHLPRITLILFIQLFGFFFLKLYRSSLESIKYFQNELTNVELRFIAINASIMSGNEKSMTSIVSTFSKTERNFLLQKGQTTVEIEKTRLDNEKNDDIVAMLTDVIKKTSTSKEIAGHS